MQDFLILIPFPTQSILYYNVSYLCWMLIKNILSNFWARLHKQSTPGTLYRLGFFLLLYFIGRYFIMFVVESSLFSQLVTFLHQSLQFFIDKTSTGFWGIFYTNIRSTHDYRVIINNCEVIHLSTGCSGLYQIFRITFILLFYPLPWKTKTWLFPLSWIIIILAATIHYIILIPIAYYWPEYFSFSHDWLTKFLFYGFFFLTWLVWEKVGYPKKK